MTGNHPGRPGNPARRANPSLDQLAAQIRNDRKGRNPHLVALEGVEQQLLELFVKVGGEQVDPAQAGATALILGQLLSDLVTKLPAEQQQNAPSIIINLMRMMGQRLYADELPSNELRCPFVLASGKACSFKPSYTMGGTLTAVMTGHVALHHPGQTWPPVEDDVNEGQADDVVPPVAAMSPAEVDQTMVYGICEQGHPRAERVSVDPVDEEYHHAELYCPTCEHIQREQQQILDLVNQHREPAPTGECSHCHFEVPLISLDDFDSTVIGVAQHVLDGTPFECPGGGKPAAQRPYQDAGMSDRLESEQPFEAKPFNGPTLSSLLSCVRCHEHPAAVATGNGRICLLCWRELYPDANPGVSVTVNSQGEIEVHDAADEMKRAAAELTLTEARRELPPVFASELKPGDIGLTGRFPSTRFEPGFDADGNINEISMVTDGGRRTDVIGSKLLIVDDPHFTPAQPRVPVKDCKHPQRARMHLFGKDHCYDCGHAVQPDTGEVDG